MGITGSGIDCSTLTVPLLRSYSSQWRKKGELSGGELMEMCGGWWAGCSWNKWPCEGKNGGKKKKRFLSMWRFPYSFVLHRSGTPSGLCLCVTLPLENPLVWEPPLQHVHPLPGFSAKGVQGGMVSLLLDRVNSGVRIGCSLLMLPLEWSPVQFSL
jgi:hypothetical protein